MIIFISRKHLKRLEQIMSEFTDKFDAALANVVKAGATEAEIKKLAELVDANNAANTATDAEQSDAILRLTEALGASTPPTTEPIP